MEGDVLMAGASAPALLAMTGVMITTMLGLLKWFTARTLGEIEERLKRIDEIERRFDRLMTELPLYYQRRDDAIREYTAINAKLDRLYEMLAERK